MQEVGKNNKVGANTGMLKGGESRRFLIYSPFQERDTRTGISKLLLSINCATKQLHRRCGEDKSRVETWTSILTRKSHRPSSESLSFIYYPLYAYFAANFQLMSVL